MSPGGEEPTPMGTPVPAGQCPHCGGLLWLVLRPRPPLALPVKPGETALVPKSDKRLAPTDRIDR